MEADTKITIVMLVVIFDWKSTVPSCGHFRQRRSTCNLLATAVSARPAINLDNFDAHPRRPADPAGELLKVYKKRILTLLNKNHSALYTLHWKVTM